MRSAEADIIRTIRQNIQHIGHFHTAANPGRNELDETQELYYPPICGAIAATDYDGYVGQEFNPRNGETWAASLEAAYRVCDVQQSATPGCAGNGLELADLLECDLSAEK
jgi:hydroxypyruvate isomerase